MKRVVTAVGVQVEITTYDDEGKVVARPAQPETFVVLEAFIPDPVLQWIWSQVPKREP